MKIKFYDKEHNLLASQEKYFVDFNGDIFEKLTVIMITNEIEIVTTIKRDDIYAEADSWINIEERLPTIWEEVIVYSLNGDIYGYGDKRVVFEAYRNSDVPALMRDFSRSDLDIEPVTVENVLYWQPFPKPPTGEKNDK